MSLFDSIRGAQQRQPQQPQQPQTMQQAMQQLQEGIRQIQQDPRSFVEQAGYNVPAGMTDPHQMVAQIINSGQVTGPRLRMAQAMIQNMGLKL